MKKMAKEFKEFIMRGNVLDMAVGVIIATAFGNITTTLINNVIMPFIGWIIGDIDLSSLDIVLRPAVMDGDTVVKEALVLGIGTFISAIINFILIALIVFLIVKAFNKLHKKKEEEPAPAAEPEPTKEELLLTEIRDLLKEKSENK
jgi:large conductance mechanosensitive channel